ncbi:hypothetical protein GDO78_018108 [Eleutherodactylus coqui]|uniref:Uncharacterized protein n=1 Tax=Eleutherodactylus coqui TaxID=57060 RepID=A0A8J6EPD3_ELECQ|nr:hypothetical protein GDO78_018108 [Eleutherodactylus coqui]
MTPLPVSLSPFNFCKVKKTFEAKKRKSAAICCVVNAKNWHKSIDNFISKIFACRQGTGANCLVGRIPSCSPAYTAAVWYNELLHIRAILPQVQEGW